MVRKPEILLQKLKLVSEKKNENEPKQRRDILYFSAILACKEAQSSAISKLMLC